MITRYEEGPETVYSIGPNQHLVAGNYRNTIVHFFILDAISELALLQVAQGGETDVVDIFWQEVMRLRDLFKFEFYYPPKDQFRSEITDRLTDRNPGWADNLRAGASGIGQMMRSFHPLFAHATLLPIVEAYSVVAAGLLEAKTDAENTLVDEPAFIRHCLTLGKQLLLQQRIFSEESVTKTNLLNGLRLARNRKIIDAASEFVSSTQSQAFAAELKDVLRRINAVQSLSTGHRTGLPD